MAWDLDGVNQYLDCVMPAAVKAAPGGPMTMVAFVELDAATDGAFINNMSGSTVFQFIEVFSSFNYGTSAGARNGPVATAQTPSAVGTPYIVIITKNTGNIAPEYTLIPWVAGVPGTPVTGTLTGGGVTLGDGVAAGASGFIRIGRWGTSGTEYVNGRIIALAQYLAFKDATARALLISWAAWLATGSTGAGLAWAMEFTALTTRVDASGNGGDETGRFGTATITLAADPANFFSSTTTAPDTSPPAAMRWASTQETAVADGVAADTAAPGALRWRSTVETSQVGVVALDTSTPGAFRWRGSLVETGAVSVVGSDTVIGGYRWRSSLTEAGLVSLVIADVASLGYRFRESPASGESATVGIDSLVTGWSWRSRPVDGAVIDVIGADTQPLGWRLGVSVASGSVSVVGTDTPNGLRWRTGVTGSIVNPPDPGGDIVGYDLIAFGWRWRSSLVVGYVGTPAVQDPDFFPVVLVDRFSSNVRIDRLVSVVVADSM